MTTRRLSILSRSIAGKVALVTGAASGMGRATAYLFADEGAKVAVQDVNAAGVEAVVNEITDAGGIAAGFVADLAEAAAITRLVDQVAAKFAAIDILINNAGISRSVPVVAPDYEAAWEATIAVNLAAQVRLIRAALPYLLKSGSGRIVNIASTEGLGATAGASPYTASKHGVVGLTRSLAVELGAQGVTVNCICPGPINTGMTAPIPDDAKRKFARRRVPLRRYGEPEEVAQVTLSIVLPASSYLNGAIIPVDGGLIVQNT
jgi:3-oxoacyl-[acyl-carrier protein] reductase